MCGQARKPVRGEVHPWLPGRFGESRFQLREGFVVDRMNHVAGTWLVRQHVPHQGIRRQIVARGNAGDPG